MSTPLALSRPGLVAGRDAQALHRGATPDFFGWLEHTRTAAAALARSASPVPSLPPTPTAAESCDSSTPTSCRTGHSTRRAATARAAQCPDCAWVYAGDAYQVVR